MSNPTDPSKTLEQILSQYAVSIVERSDSSGLDKRETLTEIKALALREALEIVDKMGKDPMPRIGRSGKYIKSLQSFQDGFEEARVEFWQVINDHYGGGDK